MLSTREDLLWRACRAVNLTVVAVESAYLASRLLAKIKSAIRGHEVCGRSAVTCSIRSIGSRTIGGQPGRAQVDTGNIVDRDFHRSCLSAVKQANPKATAAFDLPIIASLDSAV